MGVHYVEFVSVDVEQQCAVLEKVHGLSFGSPVAEAEAAGATVAYPPTRQGDTGTWAIYLLGEVQVGLWQK